MDTSVNNKKYNGPIAFYKSTCLYSRKISKSLQGKQRARRKIRELAYNFDVDGYIAPDLTILAEHITEGGITQMAYQEEPLAIIYAVRGDGELVATAKLSTPLKKNFGSEATIKVKLTY